MKLFLEQAFALAGQVDPHQTRPNPRVGCLIMNDNETMVAQGAHQQYGLPHAEAMAIHQLARTKFPTWDTNHTEALFAIEPLLRNHTVYVSLEPCDCFPDKKTPSCTDLLMHHQPKKMVIGALDPLFGGQSIKKLIAAGIEVVTLDYAAQNQALNPFFPTTTKPYVCLKLALTVDGKINLDHTRYSAGKKYLSSPAARQRVQQLRAEYSGILTTTQTVSADDPRLTCRLPSFHRPFSDPDIVVVGNQKIQSSAQLFHQDSHRQVYQLDRAPLATILQTCRRDFLLDSLLVEAGAKFSTQLLADNLVDELIIFACPFVAGNGLAAFTAAVPLHDFSLVETKAYEQDLMIRLKK